MKPGEMLLLEKLVKGYKVDYARNEQGIYTHRLYHNGKIHLLRKIDELIDKYDPGVHTYDDQVHIMELQRYQMLLRKRRR